MGGWGENEGSHIKKDGVLIGKIRFVGVALKFFSPKRYEFLHNTLSPATIFLGLIP